MQAQVRRKVTVVAALAALALTLASCGGASTPTDTGAAPEPSTSTPSDVNPLCPTPETTGTITIGNPAQLSVFSSVYMADELGLFEDAGLDVKYEVLPTADGMPLLAQGKLDMQMTSYSAGQFNAVKQGIDMQWVMPFDFGQEALPGDAIPGFWSRKDVVGDAKNMDLTKLKGQLVSSPTAGTGVAGMILDNALKTVGLTFGDVEMTKLSGPDALIGLQNGAVSAAWIAAPLEVEAAKDPNLVPVAGYAPGVTGTAMMAGPSMLDRPQLLVAFIQVVNEAIKTKMTGDWREDDAVVATLAGVLNVDESIIRDSALLVFDPMTMDGVDTFLEGIQAFQIEYGQLDYDDPQDVNGLFDRTFVDAALTCSTDWMKKK
ncbi:ABC transporter substrate-binding protein [Microbacterium sp. NC79]|uniref:ABC transporter substrate-binding protein n=1 Tax=Microbacterium sp. NC79 TaxID=2851009 RepID=UPI001C2C2E1C|nr:ABC transporter substrate-binding protein [Microbacterium sp. NC79]MBV0896122.1 ABC transporter substrate-binding protein [Microbacterium sp. NC79]